MTIDEAIRALRAEVEAAGLGIARDPVGHEACSFAAGFAAGLRRALALVAGRADAGTAAFRAFPRHGCYYGLDGDTLLQVPMLRDGSLDVDRDGRPNACEVTDIDPETERLVRARLAA